MTRRGRLTVNILQFAVLIYIGTAFMWRCANASSPQGGPKDSLPPVIMSASPDFYTTDFDSKTVYIEFDEYVKLQDQSKEFFVSPMMDKKPVLSIKGRGVQVEFKDTLQPNTTYSLNFGNSLRDNNEGNPLNGLRYVFSTGSEIDSMLMSGYTINAYTQDSVSRTLLFFFDPAVDSLVQDSVMFKSKPLAIARAENNGIFIAQNLKPMDYRVYALEDTNGNFLYEAGIDRIGFLDSTYNPLDMPDFSAWFDSTRMYMSADPQVVFRMFMDEGFKRQVLSSSARPQQHKVELMFGAANPQIDDFELYGIEPEQILWEYTTKGRDTMNLWLNVPSEILPDTIRGHVSYLKHDSLRQLQPQTDSLRLIWRYIETKEEERERKKEEKERERAEANGEEYTPPEKPNPFKHKFGGSTLNPEEHFSMEFDYPLTVVDTMQIMLEWIGEEGERYLMQYGMERDSVAIRRWLLTSAWLSGASYELIIPAGALQNVAGQTNDTLRSKFTVMKAEDYSTLIFNVKAKSDTSHYVLQLLDEGGKVLQQKNVKGNTVSEFRYVSPGNLRMRVIEDENGNGEWDTGNLVERRQPERVSFYYSDSGDEFIPIKRAWEEVKLDLDMNKLFAPFDIDNIRSQIARMEMQRAKKLEEERIKKQQQELRGKSRNTQNATQSMQNMMNNMR